MREFKGSSLLKIPKDYIVVDIETTGMSSNVADIIEISALRFERGRYVEDFSTLVTPHNEDYYISYYIEQLTGINKGMLLEGSLPEVEALEKFYDFVGDSIIIGHNVNFDINFLYDCLYKYCNKYLCNNFVDTLRLSRKILPNLKHHKLSDLVRYYKIGSMVRHRAFDDCLQTNKVYLKLVKDIQKRYGGIEEFERLMF